MYSLILFQVGLMSNALSTTKSQWNQFVVLWWYLKWPQTARNKVCQGDWLILLKSMTDVCVVQTFLGSGHWPVLYVLFIYVLWEI